MALSPYQLKVSKYVSFHNGEIIRVQEQELIQNILDSFDTVVLLNETVRHIKDKERVGINAKQLNDVLRDLLVGIPNTHFETHVEHGVIFHSNQKQGFDFAYYDEAYNRLQYRNYCIGKNAIYNGEAQICDGKDFVLEDSLLQKEDYYQDIEGVKKRLTIFGEFQFGNWALIYRDLFRLLDADSSVGVDLYIYVTSDGQLTRLLSDQTVNYKNSLDILKQYEKLIRVPVLLIGLDVEKIEE